MVASLAIGAIITYACMVLLGSSVGFALNLPGIAGAIVAIGITADSFVIFFERIRDEVREGRSLRTAVETGWRRARQTILIADTVSMLSALVLFILAIGAVRGFAFTLGLTTLIDVMVVFLFTKPLMTLLAQNQVLRRRPPVVRAGSATPRRSGIAGLAYPPIGRRTSRSGHRRGGLMSKLGEIGHRLYTGEVSYDFIGHRRRWYLVSAILIAVSILALGIRGLDFGIEFKGGADFKATTVVTAQTVDSMRDALPQLRRSRS